MIRLLLKPGQTLTDTAPDLPERVPVEPGDLVIERRGSGFHLFRYEPDADETGELIFLRLPDALSVAREAKRNDALLGSARGSRCPLTPDERAGIAWFNGLDEATRRHWLERARRAAGRTCPYDASAAEAWATFKRRRGRACLRVVGS